MPSISNKSPSLSGLEMGWSSSSPASQESPQYEYRSTGTPRGAPPSLQRRSNDPRQLDYQASRKMELNEVHHDFIMQTSHRPISDESMETIREINKLLLALDVNTRSKEAKKYVDQIFHALKIDPAAAAKELAREALTLQGAGAMINLIGIAPTLYGGLGPKSHVALVSFVWSLLAQVYQPYLSVQIFNAAFYSFDFVRDTGIPGRSRHLESAKTLSATSAELRNSNNLLHDAISAVERSPSDAAKDKLIAALSDSEAAIEERYRREAHDDTFDHGRWAQSTLSAIKQTLLNLSQYIAFAQNKDCEGGKYAFYVQMGTSAVVQLLQLVAAPLDRMREGRLIMAANISTGPVQTKDDVRDMFRARYVQQMWLIGDGITTRCDAILKQLAEQFNTTPKLIKKFDEAGGFNHAKFSSCMPSEIEASWEIFKCSCEGQALAGCNGTLQELGQLVVLEDLNRLLTLEAISNEVESTPEEVKDLSSLREKYETDAPYELLRDALGLDSLDDAKALRQSSMSTSLSGQLHQLQQKYETRESLTTDDFKDVKREQILEWTEMARAEAIVLTPLEVAVLKRLEAKARSSTLNIDGWRVSPKAKNLEEHQEHQERRKKSLTLHEHTLLQTLKVRPQIVVDVSAKEGTITNHDIAAATLTNEPESLIQVQQMLKKLRHHQLDRMLLPFDFTNLTPESTKAIENIFLRGKSRLGNTKDAVMTRWNMPGYIVPALVVQIARATFMGVGGTGFFFLLQSGAGLARSSYPDTFTCKPGEGPNDHSKTFSYVMMGVSSVALAFAVLAAWGGPQSVNTARVRREFFTRREGRPSFVEMLSEHYFYSARRAVTDYAAERIFTGPSVKEEAISLIKKAHEQLDRLSKTNTESVVEVIDEQDRHSVKEDEQPKYQKNTVPEIA